MVIELIDWVHHFIVIQYGIYCIIFTKQNPLTYFKYCTILVMHESVSCVDVGRENLLLARGLVSDKQQKKNRHIY